MFLVIWKGRWINRLLIRLRIVVGLGLYSLGAMGRDTQGRFVRGVSGNPQGRPRGSLNATTLMMRARLEENARAIVDALIREAVAGKAAALKMCMDRLMPAGERLAVDIPPPKTAKEVTEASATVIEMTAEGALTVKEAEGVMGLIEVQRKTIETENLEVRIAGLERELKEREAKEKENEEDRLERLE